MEKMLKKRYQLQSGFTFVELLVVFGILGLLAVAVLVRINPAFHFEKARDDQRKVHVNSVYGAFVSYETREGHLPGCLDEFDPEEDDPVDVAECSELVEEGYLSAFPEDPLNGEGYEVKLNEIGDIGIRAKNPEREEEITAGNW